MSLKQMQALDTASAVKQEPVAYEPVWSSGPTNKDMEDAMRQRRLNELATSPQPKAAQWLTEERYAQLHTTQRKPLSDEEMKKIWYAMQNIMGWYSFQEIARAIEAAHGIKENT